MPNDPAIGMVDHLDSVGCGPTPAESEFVTAYLADAPMPLKLLARVANPIRARRRKARAAALRERDWANLGQYRDANAAITTPTRAVFLGDSGTEFWQAADPQFFSNGVVGRGISGQTSPQMLLRFMADVVALKPRVVHIKAGVNDVAGNTGPSTPEDFKNNLRAMVALAKAHGIAVILGGLTLVNEFPWVKGSTPRQRIGELDTWLRATAEAQHLIYADYASVLAGADGTLRQEFTRDGVHATARGYAAIRPIAEAAIEKALAGETS
jgi:lysophospholipase L1-like esterase